MTHLNLRWSLKDIDDVVAMTRRGLDARSIAEAFLTKEGEVLALCWRNNLPMPRASRTVQGAKNAEDDSTQGPEVR